MKKYAVVLDIRMGVVVVGKYMLYLLVSPTIKMLFLVNGE